MSHDDIIYVLLLLLAIAFGHFYRKIKDVSLKQNVGTAFGTVLILYTSMAHSLHVYISFVICCLLIKQYKAKCHLIVFCAMMSYLLFFRTLHLFGIPTPPGHTNMIHMIFVLKIIGLAFETNQVYTKAREADKNEDKKNVLTPAEIAIQNLSIADMFHYCFSYIGLLTGPYYTYKTYHDYLHLPYSANADCWKATLDRLKWVPVYICLFLGAAYIYPLDYALTDEFYTERSWMYRLFYVWPSFFIFRMRIYIGIILSESICISAGLGAYPKELEAKCGHGPSKEITEEFTEDRLKNCEYDFETVVNINVGGVEKCLTFREAMKHWNRCVQYWMAMYIYKRFPSKKYRVMATMAVSAYWHGVHAGHYFCILGPIVYLPLEDLYIKVFPLNEKDSGIRAQITSALYWILKFFAFSYMGTAFLLKDAGKIWFYYKSVYHFAYVFWAVAYVACLFLWKQKKRELKKAQKASETAIGAETKKLE